MKNVIANYHTHTYRCGHASGKDEEYIEAAISSGLEILGFSDHTPMIFPTGHVSDFRVPPELAKDYFDSLTALKSKYADKIEIHIGVEAEYYPAMFDDYYKYIMSFPCEYLILGQHFILREEDGRRSFAKTDDEQTLSDFFDNLIMAVDTGKFLYIAHPDVINFTGSDEVYIRHARRFLEHAAQSGIPLEINRLGLEDGRHYPRRIFWEECAKTGNPVIIGIDAHQPEPLADTAMVARCVDYALSLGLNLVKDNRLVIPSPKL